MDIQTKIQKARISLVIENPFFGSLILKLPMIEQKGIGTMATNGESIIYEPDFIDKLSYGELKGVLVHEVLHCALCHITRRGERDNKKWNMAGDFCVNSVLINEKFELPKDCLYEKSYENKSADEIYNLLPDEDDKGQGNNKRKGNWNIGQCQDAVGNKEEIQGQWKVALKQAAQTALAQGKLPNSLKRLADEIINPKLPWFEILRQFIEHNAKNDFSWQKPNKRYAHLGVILPGIQSDNLENITVAIDTSGSINKKQLNEFSSELNGILNQYSTELTVIYCDAKIQNIQTFKTGDDIKLETIGGGGTDFNPVFEYCNEHPPKCLIYMTDLQGKFPSEQPEYSVLWVCNNNSIAPFGTTCSL